MGSDPAAAPWLRVESKARAPELVCNTTSALDTPPTPGDARSPYTTSRTSPGAEAADATHVIHGICTADSLPAFSGDNGGMRGVDHDRFELLAPAAELYLAILLEEQLALQHHEGELAAG